MIIGIFSLRPSGLGEICFFDIKGVSALQRRGGRIEKI